MISFYFFLLILLSDILLVASGLLHALQIVGVARYLDNAGQKTNKNVPPENAYPNIFILIPLLRESSVLDNMFAWLHTLHYPAEKLKIVLITTEREYETGRDDTRDTIAGVRSHIEKLRERNDNRFVHLHYPHREGVKSDQLNFAIRKLHDTFPEKFNDTTYIGVYDADSLTPPDVLNTFAHEAISGMYQNIYQQPTWYFKNYDRLPNSFAGRLAGSFAWIQSAFALYHEAYLLINQAKKKELTKMEYGVGHGLFVRWPFLERISLFPSPIEDTRLGHIASYLGEKLHLIPIFDTAEVAVGVRKQIQQSSLWFTGEAFVVEDLRIAKRISSVPTLRGGRLLFYKLYRNAVWICRPFFLGCAVLATLYAGNVILAASVLLIYLFLPILTLAVLRKRFLRFTAPHGRTEFLSSFASVLIFTPVEFLLMSLGPLLGLIRFIKFRLMDEKLHLAKTERNIHV